MREIGVLQAKTQLSALLDAVERGEGPIVITRHGKRVALLSHHDRPVPRLTAKQLAERLRAFRARQKPDPEMDGRSWDDLKNDIRQ